jgi:MFS family permease
MENVRFALLSAAGALALFLGMLLFMEVGRRYGRRQSQLRGEESRVGVGVVDSAVFALLALLIGFAFSGAASRFDKRREMVAHQVNAISTAWDRVDLMAPSDQPAVRASMRAYVDALLLAYDNAAGSSEELRARAALGGAHDDLWARVIGSSLRPEGEKARVLIIPSVNEMFDAVDTEHMAQRLHPPFLIYAMLVITALAGALFAGYAMATAERRNWLFLIGAAATISLALFVTLELESARLGWIRVDAIDRVLEEQRAEMD